MLFYFHTSVHMLYCLIFIGTMQHAWVGTWKLLNKYLGVNGFYASFQLQTKCVQNHITHTIINVYYKYLNLFSWSYSVPELTAFQLISERSPCISGEDETGDSINTYLNGIRAAKSNSIYNIVNYSCFL